MYTSRAFLIATLVLTSTSFGCQVISAIITSPSDSISGTGHAISGSSDAISVSSGSEPAADKATYENDLREYTASFVKSGADPSTYQSGATRIATSHGITNWESNGDTADAIGEGLLKAKQNGAQAQEFCKNVGLSSELTKKVVDEVD